MWSHEFHDQTYLSNHAVFSTWSTARRKFKYLENEKSFQDEIKSIFHHFWRAIIEANKKNLEGESPNLNISKTKRVFHMKQKTFSIIFKGFSLKQIKIFFGTWQPDFKKAKITLFLETRDPTLKRYYHSVSAPSFL